MFIERREHNGRVELWECEWVAGEGEKPHKQFKRYLGVEQPLNTPAADVEAASAICWAYGRTIGNIAVYNQEIIGSFHADKGADAVLACDIVEAGLYRNGQSRWWCRTHQKHWGTKGDIAAAIQSGTIQCSNNTQPMSYILNPVQIVLESHLEVGMWCSMPPAITSGPKMNPRAPRIHLHIREEVGAKKVIDQDYQALSIHYNQNLDLFGSDEITIVNITPPAALEFMLAVEAGKELDCINCNKCGYPHLDLGDFARTPHKKHFCGNCGHDSTWSRHPIVSTPLKPLHDQFCRQTGFVEPDRRLNLDDYKNDAYAVWASTPAILWTADRPQEKGIHVHVSRNGEMIVDDTFREVIFNGKKLERKHLLELMVLNTKH